jgi:hypothetical protein
MNDVAKTSKTMAERIATQVVENVCELPDYNSPEDQPDLVMCTVQELENCVLRAFEAHGNETCACAGCERGLPLDGHGHHYGRISNTGPLAPYYLDLTVCAAQKALASLPSCECLLRDKEPSAYHALKCPRYVADLL